MARTRRAAPSRAKRGLSEDSVGPAPFFLSLQNTVGNQAVLRLLQRCGGEVHDGCACAEEQKPAAPPTSIVGRIARAAADGGPASGARAPLSSPRFAGDALLEACHQDRARLAQGARGDSVQKVQQALVDLGFDLGPKGADASYGPRTAAAVKAFKAKEQLGFEQFGDVGPGTMTRLDQLFPAAGPSPRGLADAPTVADEDPGLSCPNPDDVVTAIEAEPALSQALTSRTDATTSTDALVGGGSGTHIDIPTAIARFKQVVDVKDAAGAHVSDPNISTRGQFFVFTQLRLAVINEILRIRAAGDPDARKFADTAFEAVNAINARSARAGTLIAQLDKIASSTASSEKAAMQALLKAAGAGGAIDAQIFAAFDLSPNDTMPQSILVKFRSLRALRAVEGFDKSACGGHALRIAQRIKRKGGLVARQRRGPTISAQLASGGGFEDRRPMGSPSSAFEPAATSAVSLGSVMMFGDVILQSGVSGTVAQMKQALDAGRTIHARVLSGLGYGIGTTATGKTKLDARAKRIQIGAPPEEHSVLIIGFDGDTFVFHDPDAAVSKTPEAGFGELHFDSTDGRLSTAQNPADLLVLFNTHDHLRGDHRYQVIRVESI